MRDPQHGGCSCRSVPGTHHDPRCRLTPCNCALIRQAVRDMESIKRRDILRRADVMGLPHQKYRAS